MNTSVSPARALLLPNVRTPSIVPILAERGTAIKQNRNTILELVYNAEVRQKPKSQTLPFVPLPVLTLIIKTPMLKRHALVATRLGTFLIIRGTDQHIVANNAQ